jgi:hypothetical protein
MLNSLENSENSKETKNFSTEVSWLLCTNVFDRQFQIALNSCLNQSFSDFELVVVANGEQSEIIAAKIHNLIGDDPRVRVYETKIKHLPFSLSLECITRGGS